MPALKPCGTMAAYRRHLRAGEKACLPCKRAAAAEKANRDRRKKEPVIAEVASRIKALPTPEPVKDVIDERSELMDNLNLVRAVLHGGEFQPRDLAALTKRREEIILRLKKLDEDSGKAVSTLDELTRRRARRAASQN